MLEDEGKQWIMWNKKNNNINRCWANWLGR